MKTNKSGKGLKSPALRFSIVIPAYNEAIYIADTLQSIKQQDFAGKFEVIVVDNNSTDQTALISKQLGAEVVSEKKAGVCWARQRGTLSAKGELIISTDADTTFAPNWLSKIDQAFKDNPAAVAIAGPCRYVEGPLWGRVYARALFGLVNFGYKVFRRTYYASATNIAFKKSAFKAYDTNLPQGGDELGLIRDLKKEGQVRFDNTNPTFTSSRRLEQGFIYNFIVSWLVYYILEYNLNRLFKRPILGPVPSFRGEITPQKRFLMRVGIISLLIVLLLLGRHRVISMARNIGDILSL